MFILQQSDKGDRLFNSLERAIEEANKLIDADSGEYKVYPPDNKYYFYAVNGSTMTRVKVTSTIIGE